MNPPLTALPQGQQNQPRRSVPGQLSEPQPHFQKPTMPCVVFSCVLQCRQRQPGEISWRKEPSDGGAAPGALPDADTGTASLCSQISLPSRCSATTNCGSTRTLQLSSSRKRTAPGIAGEAERRRGGRRGRSELACPRQQTVDMIAHRPSSRLRLPQRDDAGVRNGRVINDDRARCVAPLAFDFSCNDHFAANKLLGRDFGTLIERADRSGGMAQPQRSFRRIRQRIPQSMLVALPVDYRNDQIDFFIVPLRPTVRRFDDRSAMLARAQRRAGRLLLRLCFRVRDFRRSRDSCSRSRGDQRTPAGAEARTMSGGHGMLFMHGVRPVTCYRCMADSRLPAVKRSAKYSASSVS